MADLPHASAASLHPIYQTEKRTYKTLRGSGNLNTGLGCTGIVVLYRDSIIVLLARKDQKPEDILYSCYDALMGNTVTTQYLDVDKIKTATGHVKPGHDSHRHVLKYRN